MDSLVIETLKLLKANKKKLTPQQFRTLKGQALNGNPEGAQKGLNKLLIRGRS